MSTAHGVAESAGALNSGLFSINGYRLFLRWKGQGSPTVVFESGLGRGSDDWLESGILEQIASFTQACAYDRASVGQSDRLPSPIPRSASALASDLASLLQAAQLPGPYILVAHSFGGLIARAFMQAHLGQTAGLVLVDAMHEDDASSVLDLLPPAAAGELPALSEYRAAFLEDMSLEPEPIDWAGCTREMRQGSSAGASPLIVITAERFELVPPGLPADLVSQLAQNHLALQQRLASLSSQGKQILAERSGHVVMRDRPDLIVQAVRELVERIRAVPLA